ncbi:hypothetical protein SCUCBS95973_004756 [Sporothrix curviconia]|uniref:Zn(2)-C6 fungal-type domain-containing protein n=1 Tax=Sporothrix curviconia TaxID=1260050 RepID=A0ABP0BR92_9PEZI
MAGLAEDQGTQRKRVFRACDSCRAMKSKCDGARPACGRCTGYGYKCLYALSGKRNQNHRLAAASHDGQACCHTATALQLAATEYGRLVRDILPKLPVPDQPAAENALREIEQRLQQIRLDASACQADANAQPQAQAQAQEPLPNPGGALASTTTIGPKRQSTSASSAPRPAERYLGEVSDVRFFNLVDRALADTSSSGTPVTDHPSHTIAALDGEDEALASYEQDDPSPEAAAAHIDAAVELPDPETAERFLDIYFSTIHVAYPFIPRAIFTQAYQVYIASGRETLPNDTWLATLYILFAIGAYYNAASGGSFSSSSSQAKAKNADALHEQYYRHALSLVSGAEMLERSLNQVTFLLAQCFYLLAVCRTDTCWTTLGLAVRIAQSIGLHVDADGARPRPRPKPRHVQTLAFRNAELRRRVWYSIYVLDRLLALQLGRPPAIHDEDCHLRLPSRLGDADIHWLGGTDSDNDNNASPPVQPPLDPATPTVGDYFLCMISLSRIIGHVLRDLYSPRAHIEPEGDDSSSSTDILTNWLLPSTKRLDRQLLEWRRALPRKLRFDFGHAFDNTAASAAAAIFKRQRNMLAIKFHHLRAVIHRPYLCLPLLRRLEEEGSSGDEGGGTGAKSDIRTAHNAHDAHNMHSRSSPRGHLIGRYEKICILEAQATAHLLHNVVDKQNLVHDFPWWQMISCLVYASSILVVASAFVARRRLGGGGADVPAANGGNFNDEVDNNNNSDDEDVDDSDAIDAAALEDDAETCLTVFEALSPNSESARLARNMMRRLKARGAAWREAHAVHEAAVPVSMVSVPAAPDVSMVNMPALNPRVPPMPAVYHDQPMEPDGEVILQNRQPHQPGDFVTMPVQTDALVSWPMLQEWPLEILDSMEWSTQFFNTVDGTM